MAQWVFLVTAFLTVLAFAGIVAAAMSGTGDEDGRHWKATAQIYSSSNEGTDQSTRRASALGPGAVVPTPSPVRIGAAPLANAVPTMSTAYQQYMSAARQRMLQQQMLQQQMVQAHQAQHYQALAQQMVCQGMLPPPMLGAGVAQIAAPHPRTTLKSDAIVAGEIIAWRAWRVRGDDLTSATANSAWSPTEPMQGDAAGGFGVHAYKSPHGPMMDGYADSSQAGSWVIGEVALWGDVIEHERGYRAEYGRIHSLVTWSRAVPADQRERITKKYIQPKTAA